jgi:hypothetical protein
VPPLGPEGDDRDRLHRVDHRGEPRAQLAEHVERRETAVGEAEHVELLHPDGIGGAARLPGADRGELRAGGHLEVVADPLRAVGGDDEVGHAPLAREAREQGADDALVVGMGEDGEDRSGGLRVGGHRRGRGERRGQQGVDVDAHAEQCHRDRHHARVSERQTRGVPREWPGSQIGARR